MKKLLATMCLLGLGIVSFSQGLGFGIKGGLNLANQNISGQGIELDTKSNASFHGGVFLTFMFSEKLGIQPELLYSMQGSNFDFSSIEVKEKLDYLDIPILVRYNVNEMFSIHAGPEIGMLLSAEEEVDGDATDIKDDFKGTDFGLAFGVEVDLPMKLGVGARYVAGLTDIVEEGGSWDGAEIKNGVIQIYVKFRIVGN